MSARRIGLGTVQWGMDYGIANHTGRPNAQSVAEMLCLAAKAGIDLLDTARAYGAAEQVIGEAGAAAKDFRVVTKLLPLPDGIDDPAAFVRKSFAQSLASLNRAHVDTLMAHHGQMLLGTAGETVWQGMLALKRDERARRLGVSVYDVVELEQILDRFPIEVVQLPYNIYDQRFAASGMLDVLARKRIEVHARSAFLQGLLLMPADGLPGHFAPISEHHRSLRADLAAHGLTPLEGALGFCLGDVRVSRVILGCESSAQLAEIVTAARTAPQLEWARYALTEETYILPTHWPRSQS